MIQDCGVIQTPTFQENYLLFLKSDAEQRNEELNLEFYEFLFVPYLVPLRNGEKNKFYVVSWPQMACQIEKKVGDEILKILVEESRLVNPEHKPKYDNSISFLKWYKENKFIDTPK